MKRKVFDDLMQVRESGCCNMLEINNVQRAAMSMGFYELVCWIEENRRDYFNMILTGKVEFDPEDDDSPTHHRQSGYEEWSEPAAEDNAPDVAGTPADNINEYLGG
jgi:hypothetical protein